MCCVLFSEEAVLLLEVRVKKSGDHQASSLSKDNSSLITTCSTLFATSRYENDRPNWVNLPIFAKRGACF
jgi:hypothetical protein